MTDYYPLIARAVAGLAKSTGESRRTLYERARTALLAQLRNLDPPLAENEITRERLLLEEAIRKVEADAARQQRADPPRPNPTVKDRLAEPAAPEPKPPPPPPPPPPPSPHTPPHPPPAPPAHPPAGAGGRRPWGGAGGRWFRPATRPGGPRPTEAGGFPPRGRAASADGAAPVSAAIDACATTPRARRARRRRFGQGVVRRVPGRVHRGWDRVGAILAARPLAVRVRSQPDHAGATRGYPVAAEDLGPGRPSRAAGLIDPRPRKQRGRARCGTSPAGGGLRGGAGRRAGHAVHGFGGLAYRDGVAGCRPSVGACRQGRSGDTGAPHQYDDVGAPQFRQGAAGEPYHRDHVQPAGRFSVRRHLQCSGHPDEAGGTDARIAAGRARRQGDVGPLPGRTGGDGRRHPAQSGALERTRLVPHSDRLQQRPPGDPRAREGHARRTGVQGSVRRLGPVSRERRMRRNTIRVATFAGPGAQPEIRSVPWPDVPDKAALIQIGACGVCGTDLHTLKGHCPKPLPWPSPLAPQPRRLT